MEAARRVLVVDDEPAVCEFVREVLATLGLNVLTLTDSAQASLRLKDEKFAVLILDFGMPAPDGIDLTRLARGSGLNQMTPIILVSDDQSTAALSAGFRAGANFFLYKPIDKARLMHLITAARGAIEHERRRFRRVTLRSRVRLVFGQEEVQAETVDVSLDGMLVQATRIIPTGSQVRVSLELAPDMKPIAGSGLVVRTLPGNRMGIHLNSMTADDGWRLNEFLLPLCSQEYVESMILK
jgi:DNA-binding response OmpR family regulator